MEAIAVHILFSEEGNLYLAHCLEFDLVAQGSTREDAFRNLLDAIELQAEYAEETGDVSQLIQPAPPEYWQLLAHAKPYAAPRNGWKLPAVLAHADCSLAPQS